MHQEIDTIKKLGELIEHRSSNKTELRVHEVNKKDCKKSRIEHLPITKYQTLEILQKEMSSSKL